MGECRDFVRQLPEIQAHHLNEVAKLVDDRGFGDVMSSEVVEDFARLLRHIFECKIEPACVPQHRFVGSVDELAAALGDLSRKEIAQRPAAPADASACLVDGGTDPLAASASAHASPAMPAPTMPTSIEGFRCRLAKSRCAGDSTEAAAPAAPARATVFSHSRRLWRAVTRL